MASEARFATMYRERRLRKAERLRSWAAKRVAKANAASDRAATIADGIPFGQPILVGHHSERHHRRDLAKIQGSMTRAVEHVRKAESFRERAENIERAADRAIYSDDDDAAERLEERIAELEAKRERIKQINRECRKGAGWSERIAPPLSESEKNDLEMAARFNGVVGYPPYALTNLSGNISRLRKRLQALATASVR